MKVLQAFLTSNNANLSFNSDALERFPVDIPEKVRVARTELLIATRALHDLALGPAEYLKWHASVCRW